MDLRLTLSLTMLPLLGCSALYREDPCGRVRSVEGRGPVTGIAADSNATVSLGDQDSRINFDALSWDIPVSIQGDSVTAVHLHDRTPGNANRIVYILPDTDLGPGFPFSGSTYYSFTTPITTLFELVRSGQTYLDIHTASHPEGIGRADLTTVHFEDWSGYYCS